ncbi:PQQ-binding-like beta-propeller repeat protein [Edaphobacter modestus]|uniref:Quinoprotein glucose dehydrogenase n=1 Tax=Edaphobacter modestus TaxID=388466 RepID=A0A4Q7YX23_9BACT|nr:PQQ-binding-like beta-propeller repeat protein [Edaphobacter modestus]RZU41683.1 quinoprotein glucose dehydrogenase [Edaphobacter modestus]
MNRFHLSTFVSRKRLCAAALGAAAVAASVFAVQAAPPKGANGASADVDWGSYEGTLGANHYSTLTQVNQSNVDKLQVAWTYDLGSAVSVGNPLVVKGVMYVFGKNGGAISAVDAATGKEIWITEPKMVGPRLRGLTYWESTDHSKHRVVFFKGNHIRQIDAATGKLDPDYDVDLKLGLERDPEVIVNVQNSSPPKVWHDTLLLGSSPGEEYGSAVGDIRGFDLNTGKLLWQFHTIPTQDEPEIKTWGPNPRAFNGGANAWTGTSVDENRGILYAVTGSGTYDFWGVDRPGNNLYADCLLAIDIRTGKLLWHFQDVHHDVWDYDLASSPVLFTARSNGRMVDSVAIAGKTGFLFAFDRVTGKPLFPIEERPVPQGEHMEGEKLSPTQPFPTVLKPFVRQTFTVDDIDPAIPEPERSELQKKLASLRWEGIFTPPSTRATLQAPGSNGGANFGLTAADPIRGRVYVLGFDIPAVIQLTKSMPQFGAGNTPMERGRSLYQQNCAMCHGADRAGHPPTYPSLVGVSSHMSIEELTDLIHVGKPPMPGFPNIVGQSMTDLLTYVNNGFIPSDAPPRKVMKGLAEGEPRWRTDYGYWYSKSTGNGVMRPPWTTLTAYDMNTGKQLWQVPVDSDPNYPIKGIKTGTGDLTKYGIAVTAGNLLFVPEPRLKKLMALDPDTGKTIWEGDLPEKAVGIPAVYSVNGREYIAMPAASGTANPKGAPKGAAPAEVHNKFVVFALPTETK